MGLFNFRKASSFFTAEQLAQISNAVRTAEGETSGEIRVHIEKRVSGDVLDRAAWIFGKIGMQKTEERNGVLFYLAIRNRKFAVIGDSGINARVPEGFWDNVKDAMEAEFREKRFTEGLVKGILLAGEKLKEHFPHKANDVNELSDDVSFGNPGK
jgi:uncharacterized membrane protein